MKIGVLHSLIALRCDEVRNSEQLQRKSPSNSCIITLQAILFYLQEIRHMWVERIFGGNVALAVHTDAKTVEALESLVPGVSNKDLKFLGEGMVKNQTLFPSIEDPETRNAIWQRLQLINAPILTLRTFFQDIRFLGVARKVMQTLLRPSEPWESKNKVTIDEELGGHYRMPGSASLGERKRRIQQGLHELWRFSFQYGLDVTGVPRRQRRKPGRLRGPIPPLDESASVGRQALCRHFFWLADQQGFIVPTIAGFEPRAASLPTPQAHGDMENTNQDEPVHGRCGIPFDDTVDADRLALAKDRVWEPWGARLVTAEFVRRSQFRAFFGYLRGANVNEQTERFANTSAATNEAEIADREMVDHTADDGRRSPGLSPILHIASPSDWSALFSDMGLVSMIPSNLEVDLIIPRHERKRISLPNDAALIDSFLDGLHQRRFSFYGSNNRPVLKEDVHRWHGTNPLDILQARLTEESVQEYTTSEENRLKRRRKGVAETLDEIAAWVEQQRVRMSTDTTRFSWNIQEEEEEL
jgi:hypothetical protein